MPCTKQADFGRQKAFCKPDVFLLLTKIAVKLNCRNRPTLSFYGNTRIGLQALLLSCRLWGKEECLLCPGSCGGP